MAIKITDIAKVYVITLKRFENRAMEIKAILQQRFGQFFLSQNIDDIFFRGSDGENDLVYDVYYF